MDISSSSSSSTRNTAVQFPLCSFFPSWNWTRKLDRARKRSRRVAGLVVPPPPVAGRQHMGEGEEEEKVGAMAAAREEELGSSNRNAITGGSEWGRGGM